MTKYKLSLLQLIVQSIAFVLLFIDNMFVRVEHSIYSMVGYYKSYSYPRSFYKASIDDSESFLAISFGYIFLIFSIFCIVILIINLFKKIPFVNKKLSIIFPMITVVSFTAFGLWLDNFTIRDTWQLNYNIDYMFIVELALLIAALVIDLYRNFSSLPYKTEKQNNQSKDDFDNLDKLKNLLDSGVITQEEFEQKKKQILGL